MLSARKKVQLYSFMTKKVSYGFTFSPSEKSGVCMYDEYDSSIPFQAGALKTLMGDEFGGSSD